jgi:hypothetical protein
MGLFLTVFFFFFFFFFFLKMLFLAPLYFFQVISAQTYTSCNPLIDWCDPVPALSSLLVTDFRQINSPEIDRYDPYLTSSKVTYLNDLGAQFQILQRGDSPTVESDFFIMFGHVEFEAQAAPGRGIISSMVLISEDLDEIDIEWIGSDTTQFQTNFFSKGDTRTYDRGGFHAVETPQQQFHKYTIDWTKDSVTWGVDGNIVRTLVNNGDNYYPQSPMQVRFGSWAGGDPSNAQGTIEWAGGPTDYSQGPYNFYVKTISVQDYSTGKEYAYTDHSGTWTSIQAVDGEISGGPKFTSNYTNTSNSNNGSEGSNQSDPNSNNSNGPSVVWIDRNAKPSSTAPAESFQSPTLTFVPPANVPSSATVPTPPITTVYTYDGNAGFVISTVWDSSIGNDINSDFGDGAPNDNSGAMTFQFDEGSFHKLKRQHNPENFNAVATPTSRGNSYRVGGSIGNARNVQGKSNDNNNSMAANAASKANICLLSSTAGIAVLLCTVFGSLVF